MKKTERAAMKPRVLQKQILRSAVAGRIRIAAALVVSVLVVAGAVEPVRADCAEVAGELRAALAVRDLDTALHHHDAVRSEPSCDDRLRDRAARAVSLLHARVAQERMAGGGTLASQRALLERGLGVARTWPLLALLGDAAHDAQDYDRASVLYQEALTVIDNEVETPKPPPASEIARIFRRAGQSRLLASEYKPSPKTRLGAPGGLAAARIRGFVVERVPVPITFHTDSAEFTGQGQHAAADLAEQLKVQKPERIIISGHTDPRGAESYNLELSRRRAEAVARYLRAQGFEGWIEVVAKGENERFAVDDPSAYTREQRWQMDRRVELIR